MAEFTLTTPDRNIAGTEGDDSIVISPYVVDLSNASSIDGRGGRDELVLSLQGTVLSTNNYDFRNSQISGIEAIHFNVPLGNVRYVALFNSSQFGNGLSNALEIVGSTFVYYSYQSIDVKITSPDPFSAALWTFTGWDFRFDTVSITGTSFVDKITGSSMRDKIFGLEGKDFIDGLGGVDFISGGPGDDMIAGYGKGAIIVGGDGLDTLTYSGIKSSIVDPGDSAWVSFGTLGHPDGVAYFGADQIAEVENIVFDDAILTFDVNSDAAFVMRLYHSVLNREPDAPGLDSWMDALTAGTSRIDVAKGFLGSDEFARTTGSLNDGDFVEYLYVHSLGRASDAGGKAHWINILASGTSRTEVLIGFSESEEHRLLTVDTLRKGLWQTDNDFQQIAALYDSFANRLPDQDGLLHWVRLMDGGMTINQVAAEFAASPEFSRNTSALSNADLVDYMYQSTLGRSSDAAGNQFWVDKLDHGLSKGDLLLSFSESAEHYIQIQNHIFEGIDILI